MVLSQFTSEKDEHMALKDIFKLPRNVYPVGRLDYDSEGLLLLTNDTTLNHKLLHPSFEHEKEYWVQVEGSITKEAMEQLSAGVTISVNGREYHTKRSSVILLDPPPPVAERNPPVRFRKNIPSSWISIILTEGKNRQVRKMTAKAGFPTLRLIRYRIGSLTLGNMRPGEIKELSKNSVYKKLFGIQ